MITEKAKELSRQAKNAKDLKEAREISKKTFDELFENCQPNQLEFSEISNGLVISPEVLWRLILSVPYWESSSKF